MNWKSVSILVLLLALGLQASPITLNYGGYPAGLTDGHYYVGLAKGTLSTAPNDPFMMWCIDSLHAIAKNSWQVEVLTINQAAAANIMGFDLNDYKLMALGGFMLNNMNPNDTVNQHVIWEVGDGRLLTPGETSQKNLLMGMLGNYDYSNVRVFKPLEDGGQVMMTGRLDYNPVPEPATWAMLGGGLLLLSRLGKRRKRASNG